MRAYGHKCSRPLICCPGHTPWVVQSKNGGRTRQKRDQSRRLYKKQARALNKKACKEFNDE